jgi:hypothetical protein
MKGNPEPGRFNWTTFSLVNVNKKSGPPCWELKTKTAKFKELKILLSTSPQEWIKLAKSSKEGWHSQRTVLSMMMMNSELGNIVD